MKGIFLRKEWGSILCCLCIIGACLVHTALGQGAKDAMFPMMDATIVLDAGHGGWDPGKTGTNGADEKLLNLAVVEKLAEYLEQGGAEVILTRDRDAALGKGKKADMAERKKIANETGADLLVSIHQNAFPSARAKGAQVFYHKSSEMERFWRSACRKACGVGWMAAIPAKPRKIRSTTYSEPRKFLPFSWNADSFPMQRRKNC